MRKLVLKAILPLACLYANNLLASDVPITDAVPVIHITRGNLSEWQPDIFRTDVEPPVQFAVNHDATNLYLARKVVCIQMKKIKGGMKTFNANRISGQNILLRFKNKAYLSEK